MLLDKLLCKPSISFWNCEILKWEAGDWCCTAKEIADVRKNQNRYYIATTRIEQVPVPLSSVKATNSETTSTCGPSFFGLCDRASHAYCVLQASGPFSKNSTYLENTGNPVACWSINISR